MLLYCMYLSCLSRIWGDPLIMEAPKNSPLSPSGIKCFVHERTRINSEDTIGRCYVTANNISVQATHFHLCHPFICDVAGSHYFISDRELGNKGRHSREPLRLTWKESGLLAELPKAFLQRSQARLLLKNLSAADGHSQTWWKQKLAEIQSVNVWFTQLFILARFSAFKRKKIL